jgi:hypothetical protein
MSAVAEPSLVPKGRPSKALFIVGAVGCVINTLAAMWFFLATVMWFFFAASIPEPLWIIGYVLLVIGLSLASVGYFGTRRNYGSGVGTASFAIAIVVSILFLLLAIWRIMGYPFFHGYEEYWLLRSYVLTTIYEIFFVMMILWGVTHITTRRFTGNSGLSLATGIMLILAAVFVSVWTTLWIADTFWRYYGYHEFVLWRIVDVFDLVWTSLFFVSEILATILFFMAKVPESSAKSVT